MTQINNGIIAGFAAIFLWATPAIVSYHLIGKVNYLQITLFLHLFALAGVLLFISFSNSWQRSKALLFSLNFKSYLLLGLTGISQALSYVFFHFSIQNSGPLEVTVIHNLWPLILIVFAQFTVSKEERINFYQAILSLLACAGATLIIIRTDNLSDLQLRDPVILYALLSALFAALNSFIYKYSQPVIERCKGKPLEWKDHSTLLIPRISIALSAVLLVCFSQGGIEVPDTTSLWWLVYLGAVTYFIAHLAFSYALYKETTLNLAVASYLTPFISMVLLFALFDVRLSEAGLIGSALVFLSVHQLQTKERYLKASTGAPFVIVIFTGIAALDFQFFDIAPATYNQLITILSAIYAILIGFVLSRLAARNRDEDEMFIALNGQFKLLHKRLNSINLPQVTALKNSIERLSQKVIELDMEPSLSKGRVLIEELEQELSNFDTHAFTDEAGGSLKIEEALLDVDVLTRKWIFLRTHRLTWPERSSAWGLGLLLIALLLVCHDNTLVGVLTAIIISVVIALLCLTMRDLDLNRENSTMGRMRIKQMFSNYYYKTAFIPHSSIKNGTIPSPIQDLTVKTRLKSGELKTYQATKHSPFSTFLSRVMVVIALMFVMVSIVMRFA